MLTFQKYELGALGTNAYVVVNAERTNAIVIDPGVADGALMRKLDGLQVEAILLTHAHFDHIGGVDTLRKRYKCPVYIHSLEQDWLTDASKNGSLRWKEVTPPVTTTAADLFLEDGQTLSLVGETFQVMHTPGHSPGSVSFLVGDLLFAGDVLFHRSIGRTDLPSGNQAQLVRSIVDKLYVLPDNVLVLPGHGPETTIGDERNGNPFVRG
ncbi:MAG: MBL fold metallo-hydrolase [Candidatus Cohnella colombiensis]|uniref:MBL fold metallo-hydrolase n=1 Tax=Candidatus Cohnella colombiensis TaxID=3121368 RepID=A0AA95JCH2_9BACL|nr:MAG: MBL fold metallo-hydrolase [Cohnella sp.]